MPQEKTESSDNPEEMDSLNFGDKDDADFKGSADSKSKKSGNT